MPLKEDSRRVSDISRESCLEFFTTPLLSWYDLCGRKDLPWQHPYDPYRVWLSEIMLQQTQVKTVIPYFIRFTSCFPDVHTLSKAEEDVVLALWSGLGYYSRARNLHRTAKIISQSFDGNFPQDTTTLMTLPGIGASTAAAISALAFEQPSAILDGNVKRVLSRYFLVAGPVNQGTTEKKLLELANYCISAIRPRAYTQAIMDLGATCCTPKNPACIRCPVSEHCKAYHTQQTHLFPEKTSRNPIPSKTTQFLLLHTEDSVYLEKRPDTGVWGGLWCLPTKEELLELNAALFMQFKHQFTHFQLHLEVFRRQLQSHEISSAKGAWFKKNELQTLGLPKPMTLILDAHWTQEGEMKARP